MENLSKEIIKFCYKKTTRRPKRLENNVFVIYSPEKIKLHPGEIKNINMQIKIYLPKRVEASCRLFHFISNQKLILLNSNIISQEINSNIELQTYYEKEDNLPPWNLQFELFNSNFTKTIQIRKKQELGYFYLINDRGKEINFKYEKED